MKKYPKFCEKNTKVGDLLICIEAVQQYKIPFTVGDEYVVDYISNVSDTSRDGIICLSQTPWQLKVLNQPSSYYKFINTKYLTDKELFMFRLSGRQYEESIPKKELFKLKLMI